MVEAARAGYSPTSDAIRGGVAVFQNPTFKSCMLNWLSPDRYATKYGLQQNGTWLYYDELNSTQLDNFICKGGRFGEEGGPNIARKVEEYCSCSSNSLSPLGSCATTFTDACTTIADGGSKSCTCGYWSPERIAYYKATGKDRRHTHAQRPPHTVPSSQDSPCPSLRVHSVLSMHQ
jgi:hypothetical protein